MSVKDNIKDYLNGAALLGGGPSFFGLEDHGVTVDQEVRTNIQRMVTIVRLGGQGILSTSTQLKNSPTTVELCGFKHSDDFAPKHSRGTATAGLRRASKRRTAVMARMRRLRHDRDYRRPDANQEKETED